MACRSHALDLSGFEALLAEDGRVMDLFGEAVELGDTDRTAAARNVREIVLPRAERNREAASRLSPKHPRARELAERLRRLTNERVEALEMYARALETNDDASLLRATRANRIAEEAMIALESDVRRAREAPPPRGCVVVASRLGR